MYKIGQKVVYPMHGAGEIVNIEAQEVMGEEKEYYIINLEINDMQVMVPVDNADNLGLREVNNKVEMEKAFAVLEDDGRDLSDNWNHRYRANMEKLKTGEVEEISEVIKDLYLRDCEKGLSAGEKKMLDNSVGILTSEISLANDIEQDEAKEIILGFLNGEEQE
ncbi:CarD family transcriptional regulator [Clostridia bacterium]|nr:CarD family transcriptional regulator [Clostridia bacterium]